MVNCGPLACGIDTASCQDTIKEMDAWTAWKAADGARFVMSMPSKPSKDATCVIASDI
jgi:hypothetical protein